MESKRTEFLNYLSDKNRKIAEDLEKTYYVKIRNLNKILQNPLYKQKYSIYPN